MKLTFVCKNKQEKRAAEEFLAWLSNSGEQDYWNAMDSTQYDATADGDGDITIIRFDYDWKKMEAKCEIGNLVKGMG